MKPRVPMPSSLGWLENEPGGPSWLAALPDVISAIAADWDLDVGMSYPDSNVSFVARHGETASASS